jgi:hypothetical protein
MVSYFIQLFGFVRICQTDGLYYKAREKLTKKDENELVTNCGVFLPLKHSWHSELLKMEVIICDIRLNENLNEDSYGQKRD